MIKLLIIIIFFSSSTLSREVGQTEITTDEGIEVFQNEKYYLLKNNVQIISDDFQLDADLVKAYFEKNWKWFTIGGIVMGLSISTRIVAIYIPFIFICFYSLKTLFTKKNTRFFSFRCPAKLIASWLIPSIRSPSLAIT